MTNKKRPRTGGTGATATRRGETMPGAEMDEANGGQMHAPEMDEMSPEMIMSGEEMPAAEMTPDAAMSGEEMPGAHMAPDMDVADEEMPGAKPERATRR